MIIINFSKSPDAEIHGEYKYFFHQITLGQLKGNLIIDDPKIFPRDIEISAKENGLFIKSLDSEYFFCNGKRVRGKKVVYQGDVIQIGDTEFSIINYLYDPSERESEVLKRNLKIILNEDYPVNKVLEILEKV